MTKKKSSKRFDIRSLNAAPGWFTKLGAKQQAAAGEQLRDWFFELSGTRSDARGPKYDEQRRRFEALLAEVDPQPTLAVAGLSACHHPSARFKDLRFVPAEDLDASVRERFARPAPAMPELAALFVDPEEYAFHNFENIIALDRWFESHGGEERRAPKLALEQRKRLGRPGREVDGYSFSLGADAQARAALLGLDALDLYLPPLNAGSRGGERFIFHSALLAGALTAAFLQALPKRWLAGFSHVNPVFRCNRFEADDAPFTRHVDTPYFDRSRGHISRRTVLIYLSGGEARSEQEPILHVDDCFDLDAIEPFTCVVFGQEHAHEGAPFAAGRKLFLRTELIYEV
ncbi:MAG: hypothetical protein KC431_28225, partial [Myxococcales bacterium]|nr:hypothetical protein [Myxococcales bacterium]